MVYESLKPNRKLNAQQKSKAEEILKCKGNKKLIQDKFLNEVTTVRIKSLTNLNQKSKAKTSSNKLPDLYSFLKDKGIYLIFIFLYLFH